MGKVRYCAIHDTWTYGECELCKNAKPRIYFAHPFPLRDTDLELRVMEAIEEKGYDVYDPFTQESDLESKYGGRYYDLPTKAFAEEIVKTDLAKVEELDGVIAFLPIEWLKENAPGYMTIGTPMEIKHAYERGKKVIIISERPNPFLVCHCNEYYLTIEDFENGEKLSLDGRSFKSVSYEVVKEDE